MTPNWVKTMLAAVNVNNTLTGDAYLGNAVGPFTLPFDS
jgi:hypothetical protein